MTIEALAPPTLVSDAVAALVERVATGVVQVASQRRGQGAGVIWSADGLVLTNHHVIANSRRQLRVTLADNRELAATPLASDPRLDLALLRVAAHDLPVPQIGDSSGLRVGDLVFAIGHPWGQRGVVTAGIISGLDTTPNSAEGHGVPYIRTDTRLRPGNSGGPLINARGEVIGINAMVFGGDLSIAIPSHIAQAWVAGSSGQRAALGVQVQPVELSPASRQPAGVEQRSGLLVAGLVEGGAAERGGLLLGDTLLHADGVAVEEAGMLAALLAQRRPGTRLSLTLLRAGALQQVELVLGS